MLPLAAAKWLEENYYQFNVKDVEGILDWKYPLITSVVYLIVAYSAKLFLKPERSENSKTTDIKNKKDKDGSIMYFFTQFHNINLIALSFAMLVGIVYTVFNRCMSEGIFRGAVCPLDTDESSPVTTGPIGFWFFVYHVSKYYELIDTLLIILKRKPLITLHIFHHVMMVWITWSWLVDDWFVGGWWCILVNSLIHTVMYYYYLRTAQGYTLKWKTILTAGQIIQLFSGFLLVTYWFFIKDTNECKKGFNAGILSHVTNGILILQFINFYITSYIRKPKSE
ncbi:hypothetical protein ABK040_001606 [Willaertia magna]